MSFYGTLDRIVSAINHVGKNKDLPKQDCSFRKFLESVKPTIDLHVECLFHPKANNLMHICQQKWSDEINLPPDEKINHRAVYQPAFQCTKSSKLMTFNDKFLHRRLATNTFSKKISALEDDEKLMYFLPPQHGKLLTPLLEM